MLRFLRHQGHPLHLTVDPSPGGIRISRQDGRTIQVDNIHQKHMIQRLQRALRHYPDTVTLQGQPLETTPFPDLARVFLKSNNPGADPARRHREMLLEPNPGEQPSSHTGPQALAGGVACTLMHHSEPPEPLMGPDTLQDPLPRNWHHLQTITISPMPVLTVEETDELEANRMGDPTIPQGSDLAERVAQRCRQQTQRTIAHPDFPRYHQGPVHHYALRRDRDLDTFEDEQEVPIAVQGVPVALPTQVRTKGERQPILPSQYVSLAEALYRADSQYIPVAPGPRTQTNTAVRHVFDFEFHVVPLDQPRPQQADGIHLVHAITMSFTVDRDPQVHRVSTPMLFRDDPFYDRHISLVPDAVAGPDLEDCILRAYWNEPAMDFHDWDDLKRQRAEMEETINNMVTVLMGDPTQALRRQLVQLIESFHPTTPWPDREVTVTSRNQRLTITARPTTGRN